MMSFAAPQLNKMLHVPCPVPPETVFFLNIGPISAFFGVFFHCKSSTTVTESILAWRQSINSIHTALFHATGAGDPLKLFNIAFFPRRHIFQRVTMPQSIHRKKTWATFRSLQLTQKQNIKCNSKLRIFYAAFWRWPLFVSNQKWISRYFHKTIALKCFSSSHFQVQNFEF